MARHGSIAEQLATMQSYVTTPDHVPEPLQTNWQTVASDDTNPEDLADMHAERLWEISPSVKEIIRQVRGSEPERTVGSTMQIVVNGEAKNVSVLGAIIKIGRLQFSDGTQTEKAFRMTIDGGVEQYDCRMPTGAMLRTSDKERNLRGGDDNPEELTRSNCYFVDMFKVRPRRAKPARRYIGKRISISRAEAAAMLQKAYSRTDMRQVSFTKCPDGLPAASDKIADNFIGMQKTTCAGGGSMAWQDIVSMREDADTWRRAVSLMADEHFKTLTTATTSRNLRQIGEARGYSGQYAIEAGRRLLVAANDNLEQAFLLAGGAKT